MSYISFPILGGEGLAAHSRCNAVCMVMCLKMEREDREMAAHGMIIYWVKRGKGQDEVKNKAVIIRKLTAAALLTPFQWQDSECYINGVLCWRYVYACCNALLNYDQKTIGMDYTTFHSISCQHFIFLESGIYLSRSVAKGLWALLQKSSFFSRPLAIVSP